MEPRGENLEQNVIAIIPARMASVRLPGKMLLDVGGRPLVVRTLEQARQACTVSRVIVATDSEEIFNVVTESGGEAVMTSPAHRSGSDRIAEVAETLPQGSIIVNVQGDEPLISPETIDRAVTAMSESRPVGTVAGGPDIVTVSETITDLHGELLNSNVVKVVVGDNGYALYFSRSPMPWPRVAAMRYGNDPNKAIEAEPELFSIFRKHTGLYVYRREYLLEFTKLPPTRLEQIEMLEQLRALENGAKIKVIEAVGKSIGVDTVEDLRAVERMLKEDPVSLVNSY